MRKRILASCAAASLALAGPAWADDYDFSFNGDPTIGLGLGGTVTGTLFGLSTTGTALPTSVTVQFGGITYSNTSRGVFGNGFTTFNGMVTGANYQTTLNPGAGNLNLGQAGFNQLITSNNMPIINTGGFAAITFTRVQTVSAVPEAATWAMMMLRLGIIGFALRRGQRVATRVSYAV